MQASVHTFDPATLTGSVLLDTGAVLPFDADAFGTSELRLVRVGQRLSIEVVSAGNSGTPQAELQHVSRMWIAGIGESRVID